MRFRDALRRPVVGQDSAERLGELRRYHLDLATARLDRLEVAVEGGGAQILDWSAIVGFGADAVIIPSPAALRVPAGDEEGRLIAGDLDLEGKRVLTDDGDLLGHLRDLEFDEQTGQVLRLELERGSVPLTRCIANGPYALIVAA